MYRRLRYRIDPEVRETVQVMDPRGVISSMGYKKFSLPDANSREGKLVRIHINNMLIPNKKSKTELHRFLKEISPSEDALKIRLKEFMKDVHESWRREWDNMEQNVTVNPVGRMKRSIKNVLGTKPTEEQIEETLHKMVIHDNKWTINNQPKWSSVPPTQKKFYYNKLWNEIVQDLIDEQGYVAELAMESIARKYYRQESHKQAKQKLIEVNETAAVAEIPTINTLLHNIVGSEYQIIERAHKDRFTDAMDIDMENYAFQLRQNRAKQYYEQEYRIVRTMCPLHSASTSQDPGASTSQDPGASTSQSINAPSQDLRANPRQNDPGASTSQDPQDPGI